MTFPAAAMPVPEPVLSIVVVSYNTSAMTLACLRSIRAETRVAHETIVIDNASTDGSAAAVAAEFPDVVLMAETVNHGFGPANNRAALRARGDYLLLLNPDTVILRGAIDRLVDFARARPEARIWGGRTVFADGTLNFTSCFRRMSLWNMFCRTSGLSAAFPDSPLFHSEGYGGWDRRGEREVDIVTGCFLMLERSLWEALGGFDPAYFMYGEEVDLCLRARALHGARPAVTGAAEIVHYQGASHQAQADKIIRLYKGKLTLIRHHFSGPARPVAAFLFRLTPWSRALVLPLLARLTGRERFAGAGRVWAEIWRRRAEWRDGYPEAGGRRRAA
jgi:GT2 family glycosyltransferase